MPEDMGKPPEIKAYKDFVFMCIALQNWLMTEGITTSKIDGIRYRKIPRDSSCKITYYN